VKTQLSRITLISVLLFILSGCSSISGLGGDSAGTSPLIGLLTSQLGVSNEQATGGASALFGLVKNSLNTDDFSSVTKALPGVGSLLGKAPASSGGGLAGVADQFSQLGMGSDMVSKFTPVILGYAQSSGGDNVMNLLKGVFQ
jgi:hypothetical protein